MKAAEALVAELSLSKPASAAAGKEGIDGGGDGQQQQQQAEALLSYALRRLVRGLASPRGAARQGFATALSAVLSSAAAAAAGGGGEGKGAAAVALKVLDTIDAELPSSSSGGAPSSEHGNAGGSSNNARDASLGRVFALAAVARSGACLRSAELSGRVARGSAGPAGPGRQTESKTKTSSPSALLLLLLLLPCSLLLARRRRIPGAGGRARWSRGGGASGGSPPRRRAPR